MGFETQYFHTYICMIAYLADNRVIAPRAVTVATRAAPSTDGVRDPIFSHVCMIAYLADNRVCSLSCFPLRFDAGNRTRG